MRVSLQTLQLSYLVKGEGVKYFAIPLSQKRFRKVTNDVALLDHRHHLYDLIPAEKPTGEPKLLVCSLCGSIHDRRPFLHNQTGDFCLLIACLTV